MSASIPPHCRSGANSGSGTHGVPGCWPCFLALHSAGRSSRADAPIRQPSQTRPFGTLRVWHRGSCSAALIAGAAGSAIINRLQSEYVFTWPLAVWAGFQLAVTFSWSTRHSRFWSWSRGASVCRRSAVPRPLRPLFPPLPLAGTCDRMGFSDGTRSRRTSGIRRGVAQLAPRWELRDQSGCLPRVVLALLLGKRVARFLVAGPRRSDAVRPVRKRTQQLRLKRPCFRRCHSRLRAKAGLPRAQVVARTEHAITHLPHPQLLHHRPHRPRQEHAGRPAARIHRHRQPSARCRTSCSTTWTWSGSAASRSRPAPSRCTTSTTARSTS